MTTTEVNAPLTWHLRLVEAVAKVHGCTIAARRTSRIIGGKATAKTDRWVRFVGNEEAATKAVENIERLFGDLNTRSDVYMRSLEAVSPATRRSARRTWLESEAQRVVQKLTGGNNGRTVQRGRSAPPDQRPLEEGGGNRQRA